MGDQQLRFVESSDAVVEGTACDDMMVCDPTGTIGRVKGFIVDPVARRLRYLVVQTSGLLHRTKVVVPLSLARIDLTTRVIQFFDAQDKIPFEPALFHQYQRAQ